MPATEGTYQNTGLPVFFASPRAVARLSRHGTALPARSAGAVGAGDPVTPCGRCRQVLNEVAALGNSDPAILCVGDSAVLELKLSDLLPRSFGPESLR